MNEQVIRLLINVSQKSSSVMDALTGFNPSAWAGSPLAIQLGFLTGKETAPAVASLEGYGAIRVQVFTSQTSADAALMSKQVENSAFEDDVTLESLANGTNEHLVTRFTAQETNLDLDGKPSKNFWLVVDGLRESDAEWNTLGAAKITLIQDNTPAATLGPVQGGNIIPGGAEYDEFGEYTLAGLTVDKSYKFSPGVNDTDLTSGDQTVSVEGNFTAQAITALLTGTPSEPVTAIVRSDVYLNAEETVALFLQKNIPAWADDVQFYAGRLCSDQGGVWIALQDSLNQAPPELPTEVNDYWRNIILPGANGTNGVNGYAYFAYASADDGTDFSLVPGPGLTYIAAKASAVALTPLVGDFVGLWRRYIGTDGDDGVDGLNAFTTTTAGFVMPAIDATVNVSVTSSAFAAIGQNLFIATAGMLQVTAKPDGTTLTLKNLGYTGNAVATTNIATTQQVSPGGIKGADGNAGDMILNAPQTNTGAKTFADQTIRVANVGGTQVTALRSAATAARTATFPDRSGTVALAPAPTAITWATTINLDFSAEPWRTLTINGATTFATSNPVAGAYKLLEITGGAEDYVFTWPGWKWKGQPAPASIKAGIKMQLELWCYGNTAADISARYHMEGSAVSCQLLEISTEDETEINPGADSVWHTVVATVTSDEYDTPFDHDLLLKVLNASAGKRADCYLNIAASPNPTVRIWNDAVGEAGEELFTINGAGYVQHIKAEFIFIDGAWEFLKWSYIDGRQSGNRCSRAAIEYAATTFIDFDGPSVQELLLDSGNVTFETLDTSRAGNGVTKTVLVKVTAAGAARTLGYHADMNGVGAALIDSLEDGESCYVNFTSNGPAETDTDVATAPRF